MGAIFQNILQLALSPQKGWEDIESNTSDAAAIRKCATFPMIVAAALTTPMQMVYHHELTLVDVILKGMAVFVSLFAGYFIAEYSNAVFMPKYVGEIDDDERCRVMTCYAYAMLGLSVVICNFMPVAVGLPVILPICVGLILWKGEGYLGVPPAQDMKYSLYVFAAIILPPLFLRFILGWVIGDWHPESTALL